MPGGVRGPTRNSVGALAARRAHDDEHVGHVAARHEPLLAADPPAAARQRLGRRRDPRRVRAGVRLGHRVGVLAPRRAGSAAASGRSARRPGRPDVVGVRDVPGERVRRAAELLLDQRPRRRATSPGRRARRACRPPSRPAAMRPARIAATSSAGNRPPARSAASSRGISSSSTKRRARSGDLLGRRVRHAAWSSSSRLQRSRPGSPSGERVVVGHDLAHERARSPVGALAPRRGERRGLAQPRLPGVAPRAQHEPLGDGPLGPTSASGGGGGPPRGIARARGGRSRSGSGVSESQLSSRQPLTATISCD